MTQMRHPSGVPSLLWLPEFSFLYDLNRKILSFLNYISFSVDGKVTSLVLNFFLAGEHTDIPPENSIPPHFQTIYNNLLACKKRICAV
jgi:hypothetical protein